MGWAWIVLAQTFLSLHATSRECSKTFFNLFASHKLASPLQPTETQLANSVTLSFANMDASVCWQNSLLLRSSNGAAHHLVFEPQFMKTSQGLLELRIEPTLMNAVLL
jgi:hypothetical protein